jgi:hypothetical protein
MNRPTDYAELLRELRIRCSEAHPAANVGPCGRCEYCRAGAAIEALLEVLKLAQRRTRQADPDANHGKYCPLTIVDDVQEIIDLVLQKEDQDVPEDYADELGLR